MFDTPVGLGGPEGRGRAEDLTVTGGELEAVEEEEAEERGGDLHSKQ